VPDVPTEAAILGASPERMTFPLPAIFTAAVELLDSLQGPQTYRTIRLRPENAWRRLYRLLNPRTLPLRSTGVSSVGWVQSIEYQADLDEGVKRALLDLAYATADVNGAVEAYPELRTAALYSATEVGEVRPAVDVEVLDQVTARRVRRAEALMARARRFLRNGITGLWVRMPDADRQRVPDADRRAAIRLGCPHDSPESLPVRRLDRTGTYDSDRWLTVGLLTRSPLLPPTEEEEPMPPSSGVELRAEKPDTAVQPGEVPADPQKEQVGADTKTPSPPTAADQPSGGGTPTANTGVVSKQQNVQSAGAAAVPEWVYLFGQKQQKLLLLLWDKGWVSAKELCKELEYDNRETAMENLHRRKTATNANLTERSKVIGSDWEIAEQTRDGDLNFALRQLERQK
jgi:hypothetical protein